MRNLYGFVNATENAYFERLDNLEKLNNRLQSLAILQVRAEMTETIQSRWEWVDQLPSEFRENGLFLEDVKDELRQEAQFHIQRQKEMGMDKHHLRLLEEMLVIS